MLQLKDVTKIYKTKSEDVYALDKVNLTFGETGMVFVTGKSGSGKTTLLNVVGGLDSFDEGDIIIKGRSFAQFKQRDFDDYRNTFVGFVFQEYNLLNEMTVEKNISLAMELQGQNKRDIDKINKILDDVDLAGLNKRLPGELSGGQKQRVAIARALVKDPKIILTDEPTGALDTKSGVQVMNVLKRLSTQRLVIIVSHNMDLARSYADRIIEMKDGKIVRDYTLTRNESAAKLNIKELEDKVIVKRGVKLNDSELAVLQGAVEHNKDVQIVDDNNFYVETDTEPVVSKPYSAQESKFIKGRLGVGNNLKLGLSNLKIKPIRLIITIILCAIAFSVFGLFDTLSVYDEARLTANTLRNSNVPSVVLTATNMEANGKETEFNVSQSIVDQLKNETGLYFKGIYNISAKPQETKDIANISMYYINSRLDGVVEVDNDDLNALGLKLQTGRLPTSYDEIAISNYYAMCLANFGYQYGDFFVNGDNCNDITPADFVRDEPLVLTLNQTEYKIVGIVDIGAIDSKYDTLLTDYTLSSKSFQTEFQNYVKNSFCLYGFVKQGFVDNKYVESKTLLQYKNPCYDYDFDLIDKDEVQYYFNYSQLLHVGGSVFFIDGDKKSLADNEILISLQMVETVYASVIDKFIERAEVVNGNDKEFLESYLETLKNSKNSTETRFEAARDLITLLCKKGYNNSIGKLQLSTTVSKIDPTRYDSSNSGEFAKVELPFNEYKVVGFYTDLDTTTNSRAMVLTLGGISNLGIDINQGPYSAVIAPSTKSNATIGKIVSLVKRDSGIKYSSSNNVIAIISLNHDALEDMSTLFLIASSVFAVFSIAMMANYISTSITNRREQIGILRALGTSGAGVLVMFLVQSLLIAIINIAISTAITAVSCIYLNKFFENVINVSIPLATFSMRQVGIIAALSVAVAFISSLVPILRLSKQKPIETIRR